MDVNNNLKGLYQAYQNKTAYNNYKNKTQNGERVSDSLFNSADINNDNRVNDKDLNLSLNEITKLTNNSKTYDFNNDGKVDINDLLLFDTNTDIDGDGKVSNSEKQFLKTQQEELLKKVKNQNDTKEFDINSDGKINLEDVSSFLQLTKEKGDFRMSNDSIDKYLTSLQDTLNLKTTNFAGGDDLTLEDLAVISQRLEIAQEIVNDEGNVKWLTTKYKLQSDVNGDGKVDNTDVNLLRSASKSIGQQLGESYHTVTATKTEYNAVQNNVAELTQQQTNDKETLTQANNEFTIAKNELNKAKEEQTVAQNELAEATNTLNDKKAALTSAQTAQSEAQKHYDYANTRLTQAKNSLAQAKENLKTATGYEKEMYQDMIESIEADIQELTKKQQTRKTVLLNAREATKNAQKEYETAETNKKNAENKLTKANQAVTNARKNYAAKSTAHQKAQAQYNQTTTKLNTANENLKTAENNYNKIKSYFDKAIELNHEENKEYKRNYENSTNAIQKTLTNAQQAQENAKAEYLKTVQSAKEKKTKLTKAQNAENEAQKHYDYANTRLTQAIDSLAQAKEKLKTATGYEKEMYQDMIESIEADIQELTKKQQARKTVLLNAREATKVAQNEYNTAETNRKNAYTKLTTANNAVTTAQNELNNTKESYDTSKLEQKTKDALYKAKNAVSKAQTQYNETTTALKQAKSALSKAKEKLKTATGYEKEIYEKSVKDITADIERLTNEQKEQQQALNKAKAEQQKAQAEYDTAVKNRENANKKLNG